MNPNQQTNSSSSSNNVINQLGGKHIKKSSSKLSKTKKYKIN